MMMLVLKFYLVIAMLLWLWDIRTAHAWRGALLWPLAALAALATIVILRGALALVLAPPSIFLAWRALSLSYCALVGRGIGEASTALIIAQLRYEAALARAVAWMRALADQLATARADTLERQQHERAARDV